jgi:hypothetical protein
MTDGVHTVVLSKMLEAYQTELEDPTKRPSPLHNVTMSRNKKDVCFRLNNVSPGNSCGIRISRSLPQRDFETKFNVFLAQRQQVKKMGSLFHTTDLRRSFVVDQRPASGPRRRSAEERAAADASRAVKRTRRSAQLLVDSDDECSAPARRQSDEEETEDESTEQVVVRPPLAGQPSRHTNAHATHAASTAYLSPQVGAPAALDGCASAIVKLIQGMQEESERAKTAAQQQVAQVNARCEELSGQVVASNQTLLKRQREAVSRTQLMLQECFEEQLALLRRQLLLITTTPNEYQREVLYRLLRFQAGTWEGLKASCTSSRMLNRVANSTRRLSHDIRRLVVLRPGEHMAFEVSASLESGLTITTTTTTDAVPVLAAATTNSSSSSSSSSSTTCSTCVPKAHNTKNYK